MNMKKKHKLFMVVSTIIIIILVSVLVMFLSIYSLNKYVSEVLFGTVEHTIYNSEVLENEIGKVSDVQFKLFPVYYYKYENFRREAKLTYSVTALDKAYLIVVYIKDFYYDGNVYAYQIEDKIIYEQLDFEDKFLNSVINYDFEEDV